MDLWLLYRQTRNGLITTSFFRVFLCLLPRYHRPIWSRFAMFFLFILLAIFDLFFSVLEPVRLRLSDRLLDLSLFFAFQMTFSPRVKRPLRIDRNVQWKDKSGYILARCDHTLVRDHDLNQIFYLDVIRVHTWQNFCLHLAERRRHGTARRKISRHHKSILFVICRSHLFH